MKKSAVRILPQQVVAFSLKRQYLSDPAKRPMDIVRRLIAIQAQYEISIPIAIWSRCNDLASNWIELTLFRTREIVKTWCLRGTVHILASADLALLIRAIGRQQKCEYEQFMNTRRGINAQEIQRLNALTLHALTERPLSRSALHTAVPELANIQGASWGLDVKGLAFTGDIIFANSEGGESCFTRRDVWLPALHWDLPSEDEARRDLLVRYLTGYGVGTMQDFAHWSGMKMKDARSIFKACASDLATAEVSGWGKDYYFRTQDESNLTSDNGTIPEVLLLPKFDPLLMGYRHKSRFVDEKNLTRVYGPGGQVEAIVLLQGCAVATWRMHAQGSKLRLSITPFKRLNPHKRSVITGEAERLAAFLEAKDLNLVFSGI